MEYRYHLNNLLCNVKQSSIFNYVYANVNYILTACKGSFEHTYCVDTWPGIELLIIIIIIIDVMWQVLSCD